MTYVQTRYRDNIAHGLCGSCGRTPEPGFATCLKCRRGHTKRRKAMKERRRAAGLCTTTGEPTMRSRLLVLEEQVKQLVKDMEQLKNADLYRTDRPIGLA